MPPLQALDPYLSVHSNLVAEARISSHLRADSDYGHMKQLVHGAPGHDVSYERCGEGSPPLD